MDENMIFQKNPVGSANTIPQSPVEPVIPDPLSAQHTPVPPAPPPSSPTPPSTPFHDDAPSLFSFSLLIKAVIGLVCFALILFLVFGVLLPRFSNKKIEKVQLTYWGLWESDAVMNTIVSDFERENPNITVSYKQEAIKDYRERLITRIQNGTGPDIFRFHNSWTGMLSSVLSPIPNNIITQDSFGKVFYPVASQDLIRNGALYGIPLEIDTLSLFINTDILKAAGVPVPETWDSFSSTAKTLTVKDQSGKIKTAGAALGTFDNIIHAPDIVSLLFVQNGANVKKLASTAQNASDALSYYTAFASGDSAVWDNSLDSSVTGFAKGTVAMILGYSWDIFTIKTINPNLPFEIHPVPHLPGRQTTIASYWAEGVSVKSAHQKEAMLFLQFLAKKETEQKLFTEEAKTRFFGEPYARQDLAPLLKNSLLYPFVNQAQNAVSTPFSADTFDNGLNTKANNYLGDAIRSVLNNTSPQTAINTLSQGVDQLLGQYNSQ